MSGFINYDLMNKIERIVDAGVIQEVSSDPTYDERHLSELFRIVASMDEKEIYTVIRSAVKHHRQTVAKTLEELQKESEQEGEQNGQQN